MNPHPRYLELGSLGFAFLVISEKAEHFSSGAGWIIDLEWGT